MSGKVQTELYDDYSSIPILASESWTHITGEDVGEIVKTVHETAIDVGGAIYRTPRTAIWGRTQGRMARNDDAFVLDITVFVPDVVEFKSAYRNPMTDRHPAVNRYNTNFSPPTAELRGRAVQALETYFDSETAEEIVAKTEAGDLNSLNRVASASPLMELPVTVDNDRVPLPIVLFLLLVSRPHECPDQYLLTLHIDIDATEL